MPFEKGRGCRGRKVVTDDVFAYPGKTMKYWELKTKINKTDDEIFIDFDKKDGSGEKVTAKLKKPLHPEKSRGTCDDDLASDYGYGCDVVIAVTHLSLEEDLELAKKVEVGG